MPAVFYSLDRTFCRSNSHRRLFEVLAIWRRKAALSLEVKLYIDIETIISAASLLSALAAIFSFIFAAYRWYLRQSKQDEEIKKIKEEQCLICYGLMACLDGLNQLGANGNVTDAHNKLEKHINQSAHES